MSFSTVLAARMRPNNPTREPSLRYPAGGRRPKTWQNRRYGKNCDVSRITYLCDSNRVSELRDGRRWLHAADLIRGHRWIRRLPLRQRTERQSMALRAGCRYRGDPLKMRSQRKCRHMRRTPLWHVRA